MGGEREQKESPSSQEGPPSSYVITSYPVPESIYKAIRERSGNVSTKEWRFVAHVLASNLMNLARIKTRNLGGWIDTAQELPIDFIRDRFGLRDLSRITGAGGPIEATTYSTAMGKCRAYSIRTPIMDAIIRDLDVPGDDVLVNLVDGTTFDPSQRWRDTESEREPDLIRRARDVLQKSRCVYDRNAVSDHLAALRRDPTRYRAFLNDRRCLWTMNGKNRDDGLEEYSPVYRVQSSGRIGEVGGGLQSCSRGMKAAAFARVGRARNYDLKASQAFALLHELTAASIDGAWLTKYLANPNAATTAAEELRIERDVFKDCFYATVMGASHRWYGARSKLGAIYTTLLDSLGDAELAEKKFAEVTSYLAPLATLIDDWMTWLLADAGRKAKGNGLKKHHVRNACGKQVNVATIAETDRRRKLPSFFLQGLEASFIHHLTLLGSKHGFEPISNQHDGLVTLGEVPPAAIDEARKRSGFAEAILVEKPFAGEP